MSLPSGYTELEYIQSSGTQYINTEYTPTYGAHIIMDAKIISHENNGSYFGSRGTSSGTDSASNTLLIMASTGLRSDYYGNSVSNAAYPNGKHKLDRNKNLTTIEGISITNATSTKSSRYPLFLFGTNTAGSLTLPGNLRLYSCQIYDGDALFRNFVPCMNAAGAIGLYDLVNSKFYANAGTGVFTAGPEVINDAMYVKINGIWKQIDGIKLL